jgi:hypothetical protein
MKFYEAQSRIMRTAMSKKGKEDNTLGYYR